MTATDAYSVSIRPEEDKDVAPRFRAVADNYEAAGRTAGEALDALNAKFKMGEKRSLVIIQQVEGDAYFSEAQQTRMRALIDKRNALGALTEAEQEELEGLVGDELLASAKRSEALADALGL